MLGLAGMRPQNIVEAPILILGCTQCAGCSVAATLVLCMELSEVGLVVDLRIASP
jgi:hypothetical protein